jgi:hypothetical protein
MSSVTSCARGWSFICFTCLHVPSSNDAFITHDVCQPDC